MVVLYERHGWSGDGPTMTDEQGDAAIVELRGQPTAAVTSNIS